MTETQGFIIMGLLFLIVGHLRKEKWLSFMGWMNIFTPLLVTVASFILGIVK